MRALTQNEVRVVSGADGITDFLAFAATDIGLNNGGGAILLFAPFFYLLAGFSMLTSKFGAKK